MSLDALTAQLHDIAEMTDSIAMVSPSNAATSATASPQPRNRPPAHEISPVEMGLQEPRATRRRSSANLQPVVISSRPTSPSANPLNPLDPRNSPRTSLTARQAMMTKEVADTAPKEHHLEHDVEATHLADSTSFAGFTYLMKHYDVEVLENARNDLFPALALSLEAVLKDIIAQSLATELHDIEEHAARGAVRKARSGGAALLDLDGVETVGEIQQLQLQHEEELVETEVVGARSSYNDISKERYMAPNEKKSFRVRSAIPTQEISSAVHPAQMLAAELKKYAAAAAAPAPPAGSATTGKHVSDVDRGLKRISTSAPGFEGNNASPPHVQ
jgi:hypothetical protein